MKALVIGATGATGKDLVNVLLNDPAYTQVIIFVRRTGGIMHPKLTEVLTDFEKPETVSGQINGDICFSCMGTTLKIAGTKDRQWHIDHAIPLRFAEVASSNGVSGMVLLSAYGAAPDSNIFYSKMKGSLEEAIGKLPFRQYIIFQPGMLLRKDTDRPAERIMTAVLKAVNSIGLLRKFRPLPTHLLAEKMAKAPKQLGSGKHVIRLADIISF